MWDVELFLGHFGYASGYKAEDLVIPILHDLLNRDVIDPSSARKRMIIVDLNASCSYGTYYGRSPLQFHSLPGNRVDPLFSEASKWNSPHLSRVPCAVSFFRSEFYGPLCSRFDSDKRFFQTFWKKLFPNDHEFWLVDIVFFVDSCFFGNCVEGSVDRLAALLDL